MGASREDSGAAAVPLLKGTLDLLVLGALRDDPTHGYGVARWLAQRSGGALDVEDSALYQALHRLEGRGLVRAEWGVTENNRRARYYALTARGRRHLDAQSRSWLRYSRVVTSVLGLDADGTAPGVAADGVPG